MKNSYFTALLSILTFVQSGTLEAENSIDIIPKPSHVSVTEGKPFVLKDRMTISYAKCLSGQAEYLNDVLEMSTGFDLKTREGKSRSDISLSVDSVKISEPEGYSLYVSAKGVEITGHDNAGVFYGIQSLLQLFPSCIYSRSVIRGQKWEIPQVWISDAPERPWRGMMLDVARYYYDKEFVKKFIDMMAMYKLNKFQFHFIDDSGWRLEIRKYPRLTEIGAWGKTGTHPMGGFYTREDIREIINYAAVRGIEVIPEIEFPAHMLSAVAAYPWLSCSGIQRQVPLKHFISRDLLCVGKESSYDFLRDVLDEICELFPSPYINIGGDEAVYAQWEKCPDCQRVLKKQGMKKTSELQGYLTNFVAGVLAEKGRTAIGWEEILLRGDVETPVVGLFWHEIGDTLKIAGSRHKAVLMPATHLYFDFPENSTPGEVKGATWMPPISLEKVYGMPVNDYSENSVTIGVEGCFWSDQFIHGTMLQEIPYLNENRSENYAEYFTFPRMLALSEVAWCKKSDRDFKDFRKRIGTHYLRLDFKGCNYRVPEPIVSELTESGGRYTFVLEPPVKGAEIRYTTDGSYPTAHSEIYHGAVTVTDKNDFRAITLVTPGHFSLPVYYEPDYSEFKHLGTYVSSWKPEDFHEDKSAWRFQCSGKIIRNGSYRLTFIPLSGSDKFRVESLRLYKRDELLDEAALQEMEITESGVSYTLEVKSFEAGTPLHLEAVLSYDGENAAPSGHVFVKNN